MITKDNQRCFAPLKITKRDKRAGDCSFSGGWTLDFEASPSADHPEIARNNIRNPSNVTGKRLTSFALFLQRHHNQIRVHRLNEIRGNQPSIATDASRFDGDFG